ncbi:MAG: hypothetical protein JRJ44_02505 [Deltaproteobacteria bacterium]|nr:hypothetical protein [Deltaproteobacteria bacterium]
MSYINTLNRAAKSPTTDFHLLITQHPFQRNKYYDFFTDEAVSDILLKMERLDDQNSNLEKKYTNNWEKSVSILPEEEMDHKQWSENNYLWSKYHEDYYKKLEKVKLTLVDNVGISGTKKLAMEQEPIEQEFVKENSADKPSEKNGINFLMSIAGMFDSGDKNGSKNIKSVVSESILKKYGKK